eukprot:scaffold26903_cov129-Isochrysis_galbana.AAC.4
MTPILLRLAGPDRRLRQPVQHRGGVCGSSDGLPQFRLDCERPARALARALSDTGELRRRTPTRDLRPTARRRPSPRATLHLACRPVERIHPPPHHKCLPPAMCAARRRRRGGTSIFQPVLHILDVLLRAHPLPRHDPLIHARHPTQVRSPALPAERWGESPCEWRLARVTQGRALE